MQKAASKTILSEIFGQKVDYTKVDHFSTSTFRNDDVSTKTITSLKTMLCQMVDK